jgi:hypothetical protein
MTVPKRFGVLRFVAALLKVIAWIILIIGILIGVAVGLYSFSNLIQTPSAVDLPVIGGLLNLLGSSIGGIIAGIVAALGSILLFALYYAMAEYILMFLAVEENTRLTAALLLRMHQESQPEPRSTSTYSGGYPTEPFEG